MARVSELTIVRAQDADEFMSRAGAFLVGREAEHDLILGLASSIPLLRTPWLALERGIGRVA